MDACIFHVCAQGMKIGGSVLGCTESITEVISYSHYVLTVNISMSWRYETVRVVQKFGIHCIAENYKETEKYIFTSSHKLFL